MLTQDKLHDLLNYDSDTGIFTWKLSIGRVKAGDTAGYKNNLGYILIRIDKKRYYAHRLAWFYVHGKMPNTIDHINHITDDNRISNIRNVTVEINSKNLLRNKRNKSGLTGVCWHKQMKSWQAKISHDRKVIVIGFYKTIFDAACARKSAEVKYGYHENHGEEIKKYNAAQRRAKK